MDNPVVDGVLASYDSAPILSQINSDVPETFNSQPPPPGTDAIEEFPFECVHKEVAEENPTVDNYRNETDKSTENQSTDTRTKSDNFNLANVSMDLVTSSCSDESELVDESQQAVDVGKIDSVCSSQLDVPNSSKTVEKTLVTLGQNSKIVERSSKKVEGSNKSKALETTLKSLPRTCMESEMNSSSRLLSKRRSQKERSISHSPRRKFSRSRSISHSPRRRFSRSFSPVRFPALSKSERRNYRRRSPTSSSSPSPCRYRSRSPSRRKRHSSSSYSSSSASSPQRRRRSSSKPKSRSAEKRFSRDSYEYCEAVKEVKYGSRSKVLGIRKHSTSLSPKNRRSSRRKSHSISPQKRLRRMLAHEMLSKNTGCVVRFDASKSFSSRPDCDNAEGGQRKIARVTSEVRVEVKSTVNSKKLTEDDKMNIFQQKIRVIKKRLRHERRDYRKRPESYPTFAEEWKVFWCNRFKQIQADGKEDPHNYNYRPDWTRYWLVRVKQIYKEKYKKLKSELKENLGVSSENKNKHVINSEVIEISDGQESASPWEEKTQDRLAESKADCQENNNKDWESDESKPESKEENSAANTLSSVTMQQLNLLTQTISACMSSACLQNSTPSIEFASNLKDSQLASSSIIKKDDSVDIDLKDDISIISVLRQLSVLETQLGSSATLITNLLGNGLAREKKQAGSSIRLLTPENRLFLDVIKEKLKGQLILEVVPDAMIKATKKCIKSIDELMRVVPEPKLLDPRLHKVSQEKSNPASSPVPLATTTHVSFNSRNNFSSSTYSMPSVFPTATVNSVPAHNPSVQVHSASQHPTQIQAAGSLPQYPVRSEPYLAPVPYGTSAGTGYPMNSVHLTNQGRSVTGSAASVPLTTPRQSISNKTVSIRKTDAYSDRTTLVQSASTDASYVTTYSSENRSELTRRPSIYDKIPWSEQSLVASMPAAGPPSHPSASGPSFCSSADSSTSDPRLISAISSCRPQIPHISSSTRPQLSSSISSASHSRTTSASSTARNFQAVPATSSSSDTPVTSVNLPSNGSGLHSMVSTFNTVDTTPMISVSYNSVVSPGNSVFSNITTVTPCTGSQIITASSSTTVVSSSTTTSHAIGPIIDLTDDSPDYEESNEPINRLSESRIIQLLKNFRQLPRTRQQELVDFLRELEKTNLAIVENFKKYVQLPFNK